MPSVSSLALLVNCTIDYNASESHVARRGVGNGNVHVDYRWPNQTVHYYFDDSWSAQNLKIADHSVKVATAELAAMVMKHGGVNLSFVDVTNASRAHGYDGAHLKLQIRYMIAQPLSGTEASKTGMAPMQTLCIFVRHGVLGQRRP